MGGRELLQDKFCFSAIVYSRQRFCGGALITPSVVLTAARCEDKAGIVVVGLECAFGRCSTYR